MKLNSLFTGTHRKARRSKIFWVPTHPWRILSQKKPILWLLRFFYMLLATLWALCTRNPLELVDRESVEICDRTQKWYFFVIIDLFSPELYSRQSIISQQIKPKLQNIFQKVLRSLNEMSYDVWDQLSLHIYVPFARETIFIFGNLQA